MYFPKSRLPLINFLAQLTQLVFSPSCSLCDEKECLNGEEKKHDTHLTHRGLFCEHPVRPRLVPTVQSLRPLFLASMPRSLHPTALKWLVKRSHKTKSICLSCRSWLFLPASSVPSSLSEADLTT